MTLARINENTSLPLKIIVPVVFAVIGATWAISVQVATLRSEISSVAAQVRGLNAKIDEAWRVQNMELWAARMQRDNPSLRVPVAKEGFAFGRESAQ